MEEENLRESVWFKQLIKRHRKTCLHAARHGFFVVIPQTCSLTSAVVSSKDIDNHVLQPQTARGEFLTLSGKRVLMSGTEARTDAGFKEKVVAKVLSAQTIPLEVPDGVGGTTPGKLHVYHISRPLEGGIAAPSSLDELSPTAIAQYLGMLKCAPEAEEGFYEVSSAVSEAKKLLTARDGGTPAGKVALVQSKLRIAIGEGAQQLLACSMFDGEPADRMDLSSRHIHLCLEASACGALHEHLMAALRNVKAGDIDKLAAALQSHSSDGMEKLEISRKFRVDYTPAVDTLCAVSTSPTPLSKLHTLRDVSTQILSCVEREMDKRGVDLSEVDLGADDVLSILTHVLIEAHKRGPTAPGLPTPAADLPAQLAFIQRFRHAGCGPLDKSHLGYVFANVGQALGFFGADAGAEEMW